MNIEEHFSENSRQPDPNFERTRMGYYNPNMIQIPLETFTYKNQSDTIPGEVAIRYSKWNEDAANFEFTKNLGNDCTTLYESFRHGAEKSNGGICLGWRNSQGHPCQWLNYNESQELWLWPAEHWPVPRCAQHGGDLCQELS